MADYDSRIKSSEIQDNDISAKICILSGDINASINAFGKAIFDYQRVITVYPFKNFVDKAHFLTAQRYIQMDKKELAGKLLNKLLVDFPDTPLKSEIDDLLKTIQ